MRESLSKEGGKKMRNSRNTGSQGLGPRRDHSTVCVGRFSLCLSTCSSWGFPHLTPSWGTDLYCHPCQKLHGSQIRTVPIYQENQSLSPPLPYLSHSYLQVRTPLLGTLVSSDWGGLRWWVGCCSHRPIEAGPRLMEERGWWGGEGSNIYWAHTMCQELATHNLI